MNLIDFITQIDKNSKLPQTHLLSFYGKEYPLLFFSFLIRWIKKSGIADVEIIDITNDNFEQCKSQLETTFLGQIRTYWLKNISELDAKSKKKLLPYLSNYTGPHTLLFFNVDKKGEVIRSMVNIDIADTISVSDLSAIAHVMLPAIKKSTRLFFDSLQKKHNDFSLDTATLLLHYAQIIGTGSSEFFTSWIDAIIKPQKSLFMLSQYFFAKNSKQFFSLWKELSCLFPLPFWIVFWEEQLWRAYWYVTLTREKSFTDAKKISYKLPFSFMNREWKRTSAEELQYAHQYIYEVDVQLKNGGTDLGLDVFYMKYFLGTYQN